MQRARLQIHVKTNPVAVNKQIGNNKQFHRWSPGDGDILIAAQDVDLVVCQDYSRLRDVLDGVLSPAALTSHPPDRPGQMKGQNKSQYTQV